MENTKISTNGIALLISLLAIVGVNITNAQLFEVNEAVEKVIEGISAVMLVISMTKVWINQATRPDVKNFIFKIK